MIFEHWRLAVLGHSVSPAVRKSQLTREDLSQFLTLIVTFINYVNNKCHLSLALIFFHWPVVLNKQHSPDLGEGGEKYT